MSGGVPTDEMSQRSFQQRITHSLVTKGGSGLSGLMRNTFFGRILDPHVL